MSSEVEETLKRLVGHKGVIGTIVVNSDGIVSHISLGVVREWRHAILDNF